MWRVKLIAMLAVIAGGISLMIVGISSVASFFLFRLGGIAPLVVGAIMVLIVLVLVVILFSFLREGIKDWQDRSAHGGMRSKNRSRSALYL